MFWGSFKSLVTLLIWLGACVSWMLVSAFLHELGHLLTARLAGFGIRDYRLVSGLKGARGYVDVLIPKGVKHYRLKKGLMHLAGVFVHVLIAVSCLFLFRQAAGSTLKLVWMLGFGINCYLILLNTAPRHSDGRRFWQTMKKKTENKA